MWELLEPQRPDFPHPAIVLRRAHQILKGLGWSTARGRVANYFDDEVMPEQLIEIANDLGERPAFLFGGTGPAIASTNRVKRKRSKEEWVLEKALHKVLNCHHEIRNDAGGIDIDKLVASVCDDRPKEDHLHIRNLTEQICKHVSTTRERRANLNVLKEGKGRGKHVPEKRKFVFAACLYEAVHRHQEILGRTADAAPGMTASGTPQAKIIDIDKLAASVDHYREFHGLGEAVKLGYILNLFKAVRRKK